MKRLILTSALGMGLAVAGFAHEGHHDEGMESMGGGSAAQMVTMKGEVVDMACYIDHNATGVKHADCAKTCITSGLPVGLKGEDGKTYLLIGEHKPLNSMLAQYAAKTITVKGKAVSRDGFNMIENAEVVK